LNDPQSRVQLLGVESRWLWRRLQVALVALCPVAGSTLAALVLSAVVPSADAGGHLLMLSSLSASIAASLDIEGETTKVCVQPLSF